MNVAVSAPEGGAFLIAPLGAYEPCGAAHHNDLSWGQQAAQDPTRRPRAETYRHVGPNQVAVAN
jgi:hypothetical protein